MALPVDCMMTALTIRLLRVNRFDLFRARRINGVRFVKLRTVDCGTTSYCNL